MVDFEAIDDLATSLLGLPIDVLIMNAGINPQSGASLAETNFEMWPEVMRVNVMAPAKIGSAFRSHLALSKFKILVGISSSAGSINLNQQKGDYLYRTSKAGINMVMAGLAKEFAQEQIIAVSIIPGSTRTDMGGPEAPRSPEKSVGDIRMVIAGLTVEDWCRFIGCEGDFLPW